MTLTITTNNVPREIVEDWQLTATERADFDSLDWPAIEEGSDSASFVRYKGRLYLLSDFSSDWGITRGSGLPDFLAGWHGYLSQDFIGGLAIRYIDDEHVVIGNVSV